MLPNSKMYKTIYVSGWFITDLHPGSRTHSLLTFTQRPPIQPTAGEQLVDDEVCTVAEGVGLNEMFHRQ